MHKAIVAINKPLTQLLNAFPPTLSIPRIFFFLNQGRFPFSKAIFDRGEKRNEELAV